MTSYAKALAFLLASAPSGTNGFHHNVPIQHRRKVPAFFSPLTQQHQFTSLASKSSTFLGATKNPLEQVLDLLSNIRAGFPEEPYPDRNFEENLETATSGLQDISRNLGESPPEEAYPERDFEQVLETAANGLQDIIQNGSKKLGIPKLDPIQLPMLSRKIKNKHLDLTLSLNDPILKGVETIGMTSSPNVSFKSKTVDISLKFDKLELTCDDYDREGTLKTLFKTQDITKLDRALSFVLSDVTLDFAFRLSVTEKGPLLTLSNNSDILKFGRVTSSLQDSPAFALLAPIFKDHIAGAISPKLGRALETYLTSKLRDVVESQKSIVEKLSKIYEIKKQQGFKENPRYLQGFDGVGQMAYPMFWSVPSVPIDKLEHTSISNVIDQAKTGDLMLFSGVASGSYKIRRFTQSPYSHAAMLVKEDGLFNGKPLLLQMTSSTHSNLISKQKKSGAQLNTIDGMFQDYIDEWIDPRPKDPARVSYRSLIRDQRSEADEKKFSEAIIKFIKEKNYLDYTDDMDGLYVMGLLDIDLGDESETNYYCASFVADALMTYGIIKDTYNHQQYGPRDFSAMYNLSPMLMKIQAMVQRSLLIPN